MTEARTYTAFLNNRQIAAGPREEVAAATRASQARAALIFDDATGDLVKLDAPAGVRSTSVAHVEIGLLPRHLEWLEAQPGGPAAAIRRLVDEARRSGAGGERRAKEAAYRFISMVAGDFPRFEEATRALFAGDLSGFGAAVDAWPVDIRDYGRRLAEPALT
jgi:uncharacterized protein